MRTLYIENLGIGRTTFGYVALNAIKSNAILIRVKVREEAGLVIVYLVLCGKFLVMRRIS
jgi:hypothetical protein